MSAATADQFFISAATKTKVAEIKRVVGEKYGVTTQEIESRAKTGPLARSRHVAMWLARRVIRTPQPYRDGDFPLSYPDIAHLFKRTSHMSATFAVRRIEAARNADPAFRAETDELLRKFGVITLTGKETANDSVFVARCSGRLA